MYSLKLLSRVKPVRQVKFISNYPTLRDAKPDHTTPSVEGAAPRIASPDSNVISRRMMQPKPFDKKVLVWMKYYKSIDEVPDKIPYETMDKAQNWFRIRCSNWMIVFTLLGTFIAVVIGKKRAERGESLDQANVDWHDKINAEHRAKLADADAEKKK